MTKYHPEVFRLTHNLFGKNEEKKTIHHLSYFQKKIPQDIEQISISIIYQCKEIYEALKPLVDCGVVFDMWLVGGSVRDLLLGKHEAISDLDIMLSFSFHSSYKNPTAPRFISTTGINPLNHFDIAWPDKENISNKDPFNHWKSKKNPHIQKQICYDMVACLLKEKFTITDKYQPVLKSQENEKNKAIKKTSFNPPVTNAFDKPDNYLNKRLSGVLKIKKETWKWNSDILITSSSPKDFLGAFDFGICKVGVDLVNSFFLAQNLDNFPQNSEQFFNQLKFDRHFLTDYKTQKITMDAHDINLSQLKHSCEIHLPKIVKKYDMPIVIYSTPEKMLNISAPSEQIKHNYIKSFLMQKKLTDKLIELDEATSKNPSKI